MIANPDRKVLVFWLITVGLITTRELRTPGLPVYGMPRPSAYVGSAVVFGSAAIVSEFAGDLAVLFAAGWTLAIAYGTFAGKERAKGFTATGVEAATGGGK
jgi:hypothetical protein